MLGIPARVAVGFLEPDQVGPNTWIYSAHDLHAWPELYFAGSGWVRFEPTPAGAGTRRPGYTKQDVPVGNPTPPSDRRRPATSAGPRGQRQRRVRASPRRLRRIRRRFRLPVAPGRRRPGPVALLRSALLPRAVRPRRRERRLTGGPEDAWAELRATALDLGVPWPEAARRARPATPGAASSARRSTPDRRAPRHGADVAPEAVAALDRIVRTLELSRYARDPGRDRTALRADVETCLAALQGGAPAGARRRAEWWPRSVVSRPGRPVGRGRGPVQARYGGVVDVGDPDRPVACSRRTTPPSADPCRVAGVASTKATGQRAERRVGDAASRSSASGSTSRRSPRGDGASALHALHEGAAGAGAGVRARAGAAPVDDGEAVGGVAGRAGLGGGTLLAAHRGDRDGGRAEHDHEAGDAHRR